MQLEARRIAAVVAAEAELAAVGWCSLTEHYRTLELFMLPAVQPERVALRVAEREQRD